MNRERSVKFPVKPLRMLPPKVGQREFTRRLSREWWAEQARLADWATAYREMRIGHSDADEIAKEPEEE